MTIRTVLVILAVTHMKTGVCIAGVRQDAHATWVRPVREFGSILLGDISYPTDLASGGAAPGQRRVMRPFDVVEFGLGRARPAPPHIEDWTCDLAHQRPRLLGVLPESERAALLDAASYPPDTLWRGTRSLGALACEQLTATFRDDDYNGKYEARLAFAGLPAGTASAACTDLKWRALGRRLLDNFSPQPPPVRGKRESEGGAAGERGSDRDVAGAGERVGGAARASLAPLSLVGKGAGGLGPRTLTLASGDLLDTLGGARRVWLALGTSRALDGRNWPLVVGVHTLPDYEADLDYTNP